MHRRKKRDAPSGTALSLAKILPDARIHSIRSGEGMGEQTILFNNEEERLTLCHQVHSRTAYARGAIAAAQFLIGKPPGLYGMDNLLAKELSSTSYARCLN
jgi:4-hydroxy-tetrahydrodipicolinate reductase